MLRLRFQMALVADTNRFHRRILRCPDCHKMETGTCVLMHSNSRFLFHCDDCGNDFVYRSTSWRIR